MKLAKRIALGIFSVLQGALGSYWALLGYAFAFPGTEPGSKDYDEDMFFVPFGFIMMAAWLAVMAVTVILNRKNKADLLTFLISWLLGTAGFAAAAVLLLWRR